MSQSDVTERRLRGALNMAEVVERSFCSMIRETMFVRPSGSGFKEDALTRASRHLESRVERTGMRAYRKRAEAALTAAIERFVRSRLCDRLRLVPSSELFASESPAYDLLVAGIDGKRYGIRFVAGPRANLYAAESALIVVGPDALDELLTYDLRSGNVKREVRPSSSLCA